MQKARLKQFILYIICKTSARRIKLNLHIILTFTVVYSIKHRTSAYIYSIYSKIEQQGNKNATILYI